MDLQSLSKLMSFILRHAPDVFGLEPDEDGWVDLDAFIAGARTQRGFESVNESDVVAAIGSASKVRHEIKDGKIRAMYGHSIEQKVKHDAVQPPPFLYHGTASRSLPDISSGGLKAMRRQYVHLSTDPKTAWSVGSRRKDQVVLLKIKASEAHRAGIAFYNPWDIIWLSEDIPSEFVELA